MALTSEEANEEEYEILDSNNVLLKDDNLDANYFHSLDLKKPIQDLDLIINSLHTDLLINLYRCQVKVGKQLTKTKKLKGTMITQTMTGTKAYLPKNELDSIPKALKTKMRILEGPTANAIKKHAMELRTTL